MAQLPTVCIACGMPAGEIPQLNRLPNGQTCPTCRERVLESIPAALPSRHSRSSLDLRLSAESRRETEYDAEVRPWPPNGYGAPR